MPRRVAVALLTLLAFAGLAGDAMASSVTNVTVDNASPSNAASARTSYVVSFKATTALAAGQTITIVLPAGTDISALESTQIRDITTATNVGGCTVSGQTATCTLFSGRVINAGDSASVTLNGAVNPSSPGEYQANVHTTTDTGVVLSPFFQVLDAAGVGAATVDNTTPSAAADARTTYVVSFPTSSTGGLSGNAGSTLAISLATNTDLSDLGSTTVRDTDTNKNVGACSNSATTTVDCFIFGGLVVNAGDKVTVTLNGVINPQAGSERSATVSTSSDTVPSGSFIYDVVGKHAIPSATVVDTAPSAAAGARTTYVVTFPTSTTGGLSGNAESTISLALPAGTNAADLSSSTVRDTTTAQNVGACSNSATTTVNCFIFGGALVGAGDTVRVTLNGVINRATPAAGLTADVVTSSDTQVTSSGFAVVASHAVPSATVVDTAPSAAAGARTTYVVTFPTSSTGGLSGAAGSTITIALPAGTNAADLSSTSVRDTTAGQNVGACSNSASTTVDCFIFGGSVVSAGDTVAVTINGALNPASPAAGLTADVVTSSDTQVTSSGYAVVANQPVQSASVALSDPAAGATAIYTVTLTTSSTGGLSGAAGSLITIELPAGTNVTDLNSTSVRDTTTAQNVGACSNSATTTVECFIFGGAVTNAGDTVAVTLDGVANPAGGTDGLTADVLTTSDTRTTSSPYGAGPAGTPTPTPSPSPTEAPLPGAPTLVTPASVVQSSTSLTFTAVINPHGLDTTMHFEYGTDAGSTRRAIAFASSAEQPVGSDSSDHTVSATVADLLPNATYRFRAVATNSAGRTVSPEQSAKTPADPPPPPPVLGKTLNLEPVSGVVFVEQFGASRTRRATSTFVPLTEAQQITPGARIDARRGALELTSATTKKGKLQKGVFSKGLFTPQQRRKRSLKGLVELALASRDPQGLPLTKGCTTGRSAGLGQAAGKKRSKKVLNLLKSRAKGKFRTKGKYAAATVRGTKWDMADRCDGTLTTVHRGVVAVQDLSLHKRVTVRAGHSYLARP